MKKILLFTLVILIALTHVLCIPVFADEERGFVPDINISARAVFIYNMDTGIVIYEKNAHVPMPPASMTKLMTAILAMESVHNLDTEIVTYPLAIQDYLFLYSLEHGAVSTAGLMAGDQITMRDAVYAMMLPSGNEVAMSVAQHLGGSQEAFAQSMTRRAQELGAQSTTFLNAKGLHQEGHVSTAYDIAQIALHAMELPGFMEIVNTTSYTVTLQNREANLTWHNTNRMIQPANPYHNPIVRGIKTGWVPEAGFCFVSIASRDGFTYLVVVMGSHEYIDGEPSIARQMHFIDTANIYNWLFDNFRVRSLLERGMTVHGVPIRLSMEREQVGLMSDDRFTSLLPMSLDISDIDFVMYNTPEEFTAPVRMGDPAGEAILMFDGRELGRVPLVVAETVHASPVLLAIELAREILASFWFRFTVVFIILLIILYAVFMIRRNRRRRKNSRSGRSGRGSNSGGSGYRPRRRM